MIITVTQWELDNNFWQYSKIKQITSNLYELTV